MTDFKIKDHPERFVVNNEVHARPYQIMDSPLRVTHLAMLSNNRVADLSALSELCDRFAITRPNPEASFFVGEFPLFQIRWEHHTEFSTYTISEQKNSAIPFQECALSLLPIEWVSRLTGNVITRLNLELVDRKTDALDFGALSELFTSNTVAGSLVSDGAARVWTDFHIHADGFNRILVENLSLHQRKAGRLVQRILEIETYRMFALLGLPLARQYSQDLTQCDKQLEAITQKVSLLQKGEGEQSLLDELSQVAATVEHIEKT